MMFWLQRKKKMTDAEAIRRAAQIAENIAIGNANDEPLMPAIMALEEMIERLVFIGEQGLVADITTGRIRKKHTAVDEYAASLHTITVEGQRPKIVSALKTWLSSSDRKGADVLAWVPGAGKFCRPPEPKQPNELAFNMWRGLPRLEAAPTDWQMMNKLFVDHVKYLIPVEAEASRFLQFLAHIVQKPEVLPHTYYLFITETTGIGRNLLASMLTRVLRGHVAAGVDLPELLSGKGYTGRLSQKLLAIVDEAWEGGGAERYRRAERVKSLTTEDHRLINHKYGYQIVEKNCCRWIMFSNHYDAIPFDDKDRRCNVVENPAVRKEADYYANLYALVDEPRFINSVRWYLQTLDIRDFKPGEHAPLNAAKDRALHLMKSELDHLLEEFKADCQYELTTRSIIEFQAVNSEVKEKELNFALKRAGLVSSGRRIRIAGVKYSIIIVKGSWTPAAVQAATLSQLKAILFPQLHPDFDWESWERSNQGSTDS
jgi:hypothetical protein